MTTTTDPAAIAKGCAKALDRIGDGLCWAYSAGWYPGRRWVGEPRGAAMHLALADNDDRVAGARDDIGMGDYAARRAVRAAGPALTTASSKVGEAVVVVAAAHRIRYFPGPATVRSVESLDDLRRAVRQIDAQLDLLTEAEVAAALNSVALAYVVDRLSSAEGLFGSIERRLSRWAESVPESRDLPTPLCVTCEFRPRPIRKGVIAGRECDTCATYRYRHKGQARPKSLDAEARNAVAEARRRRAAAGEGWGWG
jgi:hypothetical protein